VSGPLPGDRRRIDRRSDHVRLADFTIPEVRKAALTIALLLVILGFFIYMVRDVVVAAIAGLVVGVYLIPFQRWLERQLSRPGLSAILTIAAVTVPLVILLIYSWLEISDAARYLEANREEVARRLTIAVQRLPFAEGVEIHENLSRWVSVAANRTTRIVDQLQGALGILVISIAVFLFTVFYILTERDALVQYLRGKVPGRYRLLVAQVGGNIRSVVYGALYATFLTQLIKSVIVLIMNLIWDVPLGIVLAILSFFIGFFPIVGSWTVYVPVAIWLIVFQENVVGGVIMLLVGFVGITLFLSLYLRPKIAAAKSEVLNFYWMFIALVTGVYTFGLVGIVVGPVLIGILKAVFDTITAETIAPLVDEADSRRRGREAPG
jgi:predicted PurR-regulated permease PerM